MSTYGNGYRDDYGAEVVMRVTCQRCGAQVFRKQIGYSSGDAMDANSHTLVDQFEPMPEGWKKKHDPKGWFCPDCVEAYNAMIEWFKSGN